MIIKPNSEFIRYTGRWNVKETEAVSTANGNYIEFAFKGGEAVIGFETKNCKSPFPHVFISVDNGARIEVPIERFIRISAEPGEHYVQIIMKSSIETQHRWYRPVMSKVGLLDIEADDFVKLPEDNRKVIEFIGDSITEGVAIDMQYEHYGINTDMLFWDDSTAGYAWLTAKALGLRPVTMGYGSLGTTATGAGNVPPVEKSYPFYSDGEPMESVNADYILINHGTNDRSADKDEFKKAYYSFLKSVRERNINSKIISLTPFSGCLAKEIEETVTKYNAENNDDVFYIDSTGWIEPEPIHPTREGHKIVSKHLVEILKREILDK